jgi:hypothetical protein
MSMLCTKVSHYNAFVPWPVYVCVCKFAVVSDRATIAVLSLVSAIDAFLDDIDWPDALDQ